MAIWNVAKYYLLTVQKRRSRTVCRSSITKYNNEVKVHALSLKFSSALFSHLDLGEKTILSINVDKMEEVSQHSQVSHDSCIGNIETGLSADDSLALAQSKPDVSHVLPSQEIQKKSGWKSTLLPWRAWILVVMFAILIIIVVAVVVSRDKPEDISRAPDDNVFNQQDGLLESSRLESLREMLVPVSGIAILTDPTTPQYAALEWLADEDPALLDLKETDFETISDRYKVALLYFSSSGSNWRRQHHFLSETSICEWNDGGAGGAFEGIRCENNEVVEITLDMNLLKGTIPSEIALFDLRSLGLGANSLEGTIPTELGTMNNLQWLSLSGNFLTGNLPTELGSLNKLQGLFVYDNQLEGSIPSTFRGLNDLQLVFLEGNAFTGSVDTVLCARREAYRYFYANCNEPGVSCNCCTHCCNANGASCTNSTEIQFPLN